MHAREGGAHVLKTTLPRCFDTGRGMLETENRGCALDGIAGSASAINFDALIKRSRFEPVHAYTQYMCTVYMHATRNIEFPNLIALCVEQDAEMRNGYTPSIVGGSRP